eukprot:gene5445-6778_t
MSKTVINSDKAPAAIGTYSQAIKAGNTVYMSGQIPLDPKTMELVEGFEAQTVQVFENLKAVAEAAGGSLKDIVKLNIFLTDLSHFAKVNEVMGRYFEQPYPARAAIGVAALPRGSQVEMDAILEPVMRSTLALLIAAAVLAGCSSAPTDPSGIWINQAAIDEAAKEGKLRESLLAYGPNLE